MKIGLGVALCKLTERGVSFSVQENGDIGVHLPLVDHVKGIERLEPVYLRLLRSYNDEICQLVRGDYTSDLAGFVDLCPRIITAESDR